MKSYEWIFFDADETLFEFDSFSGLQKVFAQYGIAFSINDYQDYQMINKPLWVAYQNGIISSPELRHRRFAAWASKLHTTTQELNNKFITAMSEISIPLQGATSLLDALKGNIKLGIITNGFTELQSTRLERTGLNQHFDAIITSEEVGIAKPHAAIFDHALSIVGNPSREKVLMVGDTPETDILGGINAGLDTCWLNANKKSAPADINPHFQVTSLAELETLLCVNIR